MITRKNIIKLLAAIIYFLPCLGFGAPNETDPFDSLLPRTGEKKTGPLEQPKISTPPPVTVEGAIWDTDKPQAIIDGEVYKAGDQLKNVDGKVYKIEKNTVSIFYEGKLYEARVTGKKGER